ncbi:hypothetical protein C0030_003515 [Candidatus Liberibacter solanacearum]|uniref:Lipoprotein n=1 Tax=Candidatus Liberibacter solanacearum TaxID=556287 RepID=A0A3R7Q3S7_9HYPH|nr:hypothetical protein [Candidatus Liberibacter solanacearum]RPD37238.1 hypothetical protein C0030_003515 [Candidatus Liberibacter solanacearum]
MKYQKIISIVILASILLVSCDIQTQGEIENTPINDFEKLCKISDEQARLFYLVIAPKVVHLPKNKQKEFFERREKLKKGIRNKNIREYYKLERQYISYYR